MVRGESVAVIYLSLLVCLALGQDTQGRGTTHNTALVTHKHICTTQTFTHKNIITTNILKNSLIVMVGLILYMPQSDFPSPT